VGNEVPVLPLSFLGAPRQIRALLDHQFLQSGEAFYTLWQGFYSLTVNDLQFLQSGEAFYALWQGYDSS